MNQLKLFIVEDDPFFGEILKRHLILNPDFEVQLFATGKQCLDNLYLKPDIICLDFGLPDMNGSEVMAKIRASNKNIPVIVISGQEDIAVAIGFLKAGAADYIIKDDHTREKLWNSVLKIKETLELKQEVETLKEQLGNKFSFEKTIIGQSKALKDIFSLVEKAIKTSINISITGETGTGKEVIAKAIHYNGERSRKKFCGSQYGRNSFWFN